MITSSVSLTALDQFVLFSSILAGFAIAVVIQLLTHNDERPIVSLVMGAFILSSTLFILSTFLGIGVFAEVSRRDSLLTQELETATVLIANLHLVFLFLGLSTFLIGVASAGWIRSRRIGIFSTVTVAAAIVMIVWVMFKFEWITAVPT